MDIVEAIHFARHLYQGCSLTQLQVERKSWSLVRSRPLECYSFCVLLISTCVLVRSLVVEENFLKVNDREVGQKLALIQLTGIRLAHIITVIEAMARRSEKLKFYEEVQEIDRLFQSSLNVSVDNRSFRRKMQKNAIIMFSICLFPNLLVLGNNMLFIGLEQNHFIYWILYLVPHIICSLHIFQILTGISIIKLRLERLIVTLEVINLNKNDKTISPPTIKLIQPCAAIFETTERRCSDTENSELEKLLIIRDLYTRLWELTATLNCCFGISLLINLANDFISITSNFYWLLRQFEIYPSTYFDFLTIAIVAIWSIPSLYRVGLLAILCDRTAQSTTNMALGLQRIEIYCMNDHHNTVIKKFYLQLLHQKITFTAAGFFNVNCTLLHTIVGATATYLIILLQFQMIEKEKNQ